MPLHEKVTGVASARHPGTARAPRVLLEQILDALPSVVTLWGTDLRNIFANRAGQAWFGKAPGELTGTHVRDLLGPEAYTANLPLMRGALAGEPQSFDRVITNGRGESRHAQISYTPLELDGRVVAFFVIATDISGRVAAEDALRDNAAHLTLLQERQRVHSGLHDSVIARLFGVERTLHAALLADPSAGATAGSTVAAATAAIAGIDETIRELRASIRDLTRGPAVLGG